MSEEQTADSGQQTAADASDTGQDTADSGQQQTAPAKTFTQEDVNKMMAREKNQGRSSALKELGIDPKDTATIDEIKKLLESKKPESQKLAEQQIEHQNRIQAAEQRAFLAEVKAEMMQSGVQRDYLDDAMALVMAKKTGDEFDLNAEIGTLKTKYPVWFDAGEPAKPKGLTGTGNPIKPGSGSGQKQEVNLGQRLAEKKKSGSVTTTHWGNK